MEPSPTQSLSSLSGWNAQEAQWSHKRKLIGLVIGHQLFEALLALMVLMSLMLAIIESDHKAADSEAPVWSKPLEHVLLLLYCVEMTLRLYVLRIKLFKSPLNVLDFTIVLVDAMLFIIGLALAGLPPIGFMRVLRLLKLSRAFRIVKSQPQLYILVEGLRASMQTIFFGAIFIGVALVVYGIIAVEFLHDLSDAYPADCERCPHFFASVYGSMCTLFQTIVIGDSWGDVYLPLLERYPGTLAFNLPVFLTINFGIMNLIMAVIVDSAAQARISNSKVVAEEKNADFEKSKHKLYRLCRSMDTDGSGNINMNEMMDAYESHEEFRHILHSIDVSKDDMVAVFNILDQDRSGDVEYAEFVEQLHKMKQNDSHTLLVFIKHYVIDLQKKVSGELVDMSHDIAAGIAGLHDKVGEELALIKADMARHSAKASKKIQEEATDKGIQDTKKDEEEILIKEKLIKDEMALCAPVLISSGPGLPAPAASAAKLGSSGSGMHVDTGGVNIQLRIATEQIALALEDLRCKCESSAMLLNTFHASLHDLSGDSASSLRNVANGCEAGRASAHPLATPGHTSGMNLKPGGLWPSTACCAKREDRHELRESDLADVDALLERPNPVRV